MKGGPAAERKSDTLEGMQEDAIELEGNLTASGKRKPKSELRDNKERIKQKEETGTSGKKKDSKEEKI